MGENNGKGDWGDIEQLKAAVSLAEVMKNCGIELRGVGRNLVGHCPFHDDDKEASLVVTPDVQLWRCFGSSCGQGGDVLTFLQLKEKLSFAQALAQLKSMVGQMPAPLTPVTPPERAETRAFPPGPDTPLPGGYSRGQLLGRVAAVYADRLAESTQARQYLGDRNLWVPAMLKAFQVGVSDGKLMAMLPEDGELREALTWLGVLTPQGREHFQGCIVVPLEHPDHGVIGLYGRKMAPEAKIPHLYLPGPQRGVLNWQALKANREVWLAESVFDALSLWVAGCREVTCIYGVQGFTRDHEELFGRFATAEVRFCLDGDAAGRKATERLGAQLMGKGLRCLSVPMPDNQDANTVLVAQGADTLLKLLKEARPLESPVAEVVTTATHDNKPQELRVSHQDVDLVLVAGPLVYQATPQPPFRGKLRVRLRVSADGKAVIDSLDLYSHRARMAAANQVSRRFDMPRETVEMHLLRLLEETERWVEAKTQADTEDNGALTTQKAPPMTEAEKAEALAFLQQPELVAAILDDMAALGSVGEEKGKLLIYLVGISRRLDRPLSAIILSQSGAGKSSLADLAELLCPPEEVVLFSRISAQALGYLPKDYLKRKLLILEERVGAEAADYSIRVLQSRQKLSQAVVVKDPTTGRMYTRHFEVEGPIAYIETTTNTTLNLENATRSFEVSLDESKEQTIRIQTAQRESRSPEGIIRRQQTDGIRRRHHNAQRLLEPVAVVVPYQGLLRFPNHWLRTGGTTSASSAWWRPSPSCISISAPESVWSTRARSTPLRPPWKTTAWLTNWPWKCWAARCTSCPRAPRSCGTSVGPWWPNDRPRRGQRRISRPRTVRRNGASSSPAETCAS